MTELPGGITRIEVESTGLPAQHVHKSQRLGAQFLGKNVFFLKSWLMTPNRVITMCQLMPTNFFLSGWHLTVCPVTTFLFCFHWAFLCTVSLNSGPCTYNIGAVPLESCPNMILF
jgi:hypothetical protein